MKHIVGSVLFIVLVNVCLTGRAQSEKDTTAKVGLKSFLKFEVSFDIGPAWEQKIGKSSALEFLAGIGIGLQSDGFSDLNVPFIISPITEVQYRYYYNFKKRVINNKKTRNNSANFFFSKVQTIYPIKNQNFFGLVVGQAWGLQRSLGKHFGGSFRIGILEHFYYDKPPDGGFNYLKTEPDVTTSIFYVF